MNVNLNSLIWNQLLNQNRLLNLKLDLSHIPESVFILGSIILEPKSITLSSHILLLDHGVDNYDSEMIFQDWSYNWNSFNVRILHDPFHLGDFKNVKKKVIKSGFLDNPQDLDWVATLRPI